MASTKTNPADPVTLADVADVRQFLPIVLKHTPGLRKDGKLSTDYNEYKVAFRKAASIYHPDTRSESIPSAVGDAAIRQLNSGWDIITKKLKVDNQINWPRGVESESGPTAAPSPTRGPDTEPEPAPEPEAPKAFSKLPPTLVGIRADVDLIRSIVLAVLAHKRDGLTTESVELGLYINGRQVSKKGLLRGSLNPAQLQEHVKSNIGLMLKGIAETQTTIHWQDKTLHIVSLNEDTGEVKVNKTMNAASVVNFVYGNLGTERPSPSSYDDIPPDVVGAIGELLRNERLFGGRTSGILIFKTKQSTVPGSTHFTDRVLVGSVEDITARKSIQAKVDDYLDTVGARFFVDLGAAVRHVLSELRRHGHTIDTVAVSVFDGENLYRLST
jgi:hypothetical protein